MSDKRTKPKGGRTGHGGDMLAQMGLGPDLNAMEAMVYGEDDEDELEAELLALQGLSHTKSGSNKRAPKRNQGVAGPVDLAAISKMVDRIDDDDDGDDAEDDEDLMAELQEMAGEDEDDDGNTGTPQDVQPTQPVHRSGEAPIPAPRKIVPPPAPVQAPTPAVAPVRQSGGMVSVLEERLQMYNSAYEEAQKSGNSSKARRLTRGIKTLKEMLKQARSGKPVAESEIPPVVHCEMSSRSQVQDIPASPMEVSAPQDSEPDISDSKPTLSPELQKDIQLMTQRRDQYKMASLQAKRSGDLESAKKFFKTAKQFDAVIEAAEAGKPVDLSKMPPPPQAHAERNEMQGSSPEPANQPESEGAPKTTLEALSQRLDKFKTVAASAKAEGNGSKARRIGRIVQQYEEAIRSHKSGKPFDFSELPPPPGCQPLPASGIASTPGAEPSPAAATATTSPQQLQPTAQKRTPSPAARGPGPGSASSQPKRSSGELNAGKQAQQLSFLIERQKQFKLAALKAKRSGDAEQAKIYLRQAKGFDPMIEALENGVRVDMSKVPPPPGREDENLSSFEFVKEDDCDESTGDRDETFKRLEQDLINQIRTCSSNASHFTHAGNTVSADKFEKLGQDCRRDLDALKNAYKHGDPVPRFHYETKQFKLFKLCTDLGENDLEILIIRGIHYNLPSGYSPGDLDTYVKYEFPFPSDDSPKGETNTIKASSCPEYNQSFKLQISRKSRACLRLIKTRALKLDVCYKRGIFKSDKTLGSVNLKLQPLEDHCEIHECSDLLDGRRPCGGKLEVKVRIREPLLSKEAEEVKEKWLTIDKFNRSLAPESKQRQRSRSPTSAGAGRNSGSYTSIEVLKYEKQLLDKKITTYQRQLNPAQLKALQEKSQQLKQRVEQLQQQLRQGGRDGYLEYASAIEKTIPQYVEDAKAHLAKGDKDKAQIAMSKKKLIEKEVTVIRGKLGHK